ncbi:hypothetical protein AB0L57_25655 [Nocardia sp. NPDC052254]|uniref:hypothetical protein n=1 Tax=Nocardia sp. NPDC052254 TaxID=3155681 RepID=UPI00341977C2
MGPTAGCSMVLWSSRCAAGPAALSGADAVLDVNLAGVVRTTTAFLPLLRRSSDPVVVNVSSGMGSPARTHDPARPESMASHRSTPRRKRHSRC